MATHSTPDLCVIGAGASGLAIAHAARRQGASVTLVEQAEPGGSSLRSGPLALAALNAAARQASLASRAAPFGVAFDPPTISFRKVRDHIAEIIRDTAPEAGAARLAALGIELVRGTGTFADTRTLKAGDVTIEAKKYVIATGARPVLPALPGLLGTPHFTTETIFDNTRKPEHLLILGAGPMGLELGLSYRRLGAAVTIVDTGRALAHCDPELAEIALRRLRDEGVVLHEQAAVTAIQSQGDTVTVSIQNGDPASTIKASHLLVAAGRTPTFDALNLDVAKVRRTTATQGGGLLLNGSLRTTNARVYAVGKAAGQGGAYLSALQADHLVRAMLGGRAGPYDAAMTPRLTLTDPPIAQIGITEAMARTRLRGNYSVLRVGFAENDLARAERDGMGLAKLVIGRTGKLLGAGIVGAGAGELIALFALAIAEQLDVKRLASLAAPHPSHAELARLLGDQAAASEPRARAKGRFNLGKLLG